MNNVMRSVALVCIHAPFLLPVYAQMPGDPTGDATVLEPVIVTAPPMQEPLAVTFNPRTAQQPLPANDGGSLLKTIPGMSLVRKGGTSGDPVFRGMAGSRLNIVVDGEQILGGCGGRMDPPTAYIFPDVFEAVTLLKGPQTVRYGPAAPAGTVLFERKPLMFPEPGWSVSSALTGASFGRYDALVDLRGGGPFGYIQGVGTRARADDYRDGDGNRVHSEYRRWSSSAFLGWTPDRNTRLEVSAVRSDGRAAYADRTMDGRKFERENYGFKFDKKNPGSLLNRIEAQVFYNYVDHVMDNFSLRPLVGNAMVSNPDRETTGGKIATTWLIGEETELVVGTDYQHNEHTLRTGVNYRNAARVEDARFTNRGIFGELTRHWSESSRLITGVRRDSWQATDKRASISQGANPTAGERRTRILGSGFARYEHDLPSGATIYAGFGQAMRAPDYWEIINKERADSVSVFDTLKPERTRQLDVGAIWNHGALQGFVTGFYSRIDDYILIQSNYAKPAGNASRMATIARNIDATTWGGEAGLTWQFVSNWRLQGSLAYVRGENDTDSRALGQMPPLEGRFGLSWDDGKWFAGSLLRVVADQDRYALYQGNIVGQDMGRTGGFAVFSLNAGYRWNKQTQITAGIDNLFDRTYAEAISRTGSVSNLPGFEQTTRVNEPGRTLWLKAQIALD